MAKSTSNKGKTIKFLHCSDIHLDTPIIGLSADKSEERRRELRNSFMSMMQFIRDRAVDYCLIAGDLFDTKYITNMTAEILIREFRNCQSTKFIIAPGRHDSFDDNPIYCSGRLPENCYIFSSDTLSRFDFPEDKVTVYGWAFKNEGITASPLYDNHVDDGSNINIVCGYCDLEAEIGSDTAPISVADMNKFGADYYALGSHHGKTDFLKSGGSMYSYSGSLESTGFDEPDLGGVKFLNVDYRDGEMSIDGKHISFGRLSFVTETIDITGVNSNNEITNRISQLISSKKYGNENAVRIELVGSVDPRFEVPQQLECDAFGLYYFQIIDKTVPLYGTEHYKRDMSIAGEVYRRLLAMLESKDESDRLVASRAFRAALAALENRDSEA